MTSDLTTRLALLANETPEFVDGKRVLSGGDRFAAVINLIDQTVIPAILHIDNGESVIELVVAGRRLCRIPGHVEELAASDSEAIAKASALIADFTDRGDTALLVTESAAPQSDSDRTQSVSITALAEASGRELVDKTAAPLVQFQARLGSSLTGAFLLSTDKPADQIGDVDDLEGDVDGLFKLASGTPSLVVFDVQGAPTPTVRGAAFVGEDAMIFTVQTADLGYLVAQFDASVAP